MESIAPECAKCGVRRCRTLDKNKKVPDFCPTENYPDIVRESVRKHKTDSEVRAIDLAWAELMNKIRQDVFSWTRLEEVIEYAKIRKVEKIGIATCIGLIREAQLLTKVFEGRGFDVISVCCLAGEVTPEEVDIVREGVFCDPLIQAAILNREGTELNIMLGLCVGHDILFLRHSQADVTPLVVKDRATGHNPAAALYLSEGYYGDRFFKERA